MARLCFSLLGLDLLPMRIGSSRYARIADSLHDTKLPRVPFTCRLVYQLVVKIPKRITLHSTREVG